MNTSHEHRTRRELRSFAVAAVLLSVVAGAMAFWRFGSSQWAVGIVTTGVIVGLIGWFQPTAIRPLYRLWHLIAFPIGWVVSCLVLAVIFFTLVTPLAVLRRLFGNDAMQRKFDPGRASYWESKTTKRAPSDYFRQF